MRAFCNRYELKNADSKIFGEVKYDFYKFIFLNTQFF